MKEQLVGSLISNKSSMVQNMTIPVSKLMKLGIVGGFFAVIVQHLAKVSNE